MSASKIPDDSILSRFSVERKNIVITGGSSGLGSNFAFRLAQLGANIAIIDLASQPGENFSRLAFGGKYKYYQANVVDYQGLKATFDKIHIEFGSIDGCIPAAGIIRDTPFLQHTERDIRDTIDVNVNGVFFTVQHCVAKMVEQKTGGSIVCISSVAGHKSLVPQTIAAYTASKYAVRGIVKQVGHEMAPHNIRVNSISPGTIKTEMLEAVMKEHPSRRKFFENTNAMKRLATADEVAGIVLYLLSDAGSYTTGEDILVDGGLV